MAHTHIHVQLYTSQTDTYPVSTGDDSVHSGVHRGNLDLALELCGGAGPLWCQVLAVTAPRSEELDQPHVLRVHHHRVKVRVRQLDYVLDVTLTITIKTRSF